MIDPIFFQSMMGERIATLRRERGFTQREFALMVGMNRGYLCDLEHGKANPTLGMIAQIAEALGVEAAELLALPKQSEDEL